VQKKQQDIKLKGEDETAGPIDLPARNIGFYLPELEVYEIFAALDHNGDGSISQAEFIRGLKQHPWAASKLGMPSHIRQEDGTRTSYQLAFGTMDSDESKTIRFDELLVYCGHRRKGQSASPSSHGMHQQMHNAPGQMIALQYDKDKVQLTHTL